MTWDKKHLKNQHEVWSSILPHLKKYEKTLKRLGTKKSNDCCFAIVRDDGSEPKIYEDACHAPITSGRCSLTNSIAIINNNGVKYHREIQRWIFEGEDSPWAGCFANPDWDSVLEWGFVHSSLLPANLYGQLCMAVKQFREHGNRPKSWTSLIETGKYTMREVYFMGLFFDWYSGKSFATHTQSPLNFSFDSLLSSKVPISTMAKYFDPDFHFADVIKDQVSAKHLGFYEGSRFESEFPRGTKDRGKKYFVVTDFYKLFYEHDSKIDIRKRDSIFWAGNYFEKQRKVDVLETLLTYADKLIPFLRAYNKKKTD